MSAGINCNCVTSFFDDAKMKREASAFHDESNIHYKYVHVKNRI